MELPSEMVRELYDEICSSASAAMALAGEHVAYLDGFKIYSTNEYKSKIIGELEKLRKNAASLDSMRKLREYCNENAPCMLAKEGKLKRWWGRLREEDVIGASIEFEKEHLESVDMATAKGSASFDYELQVIVHPERGEEQRLRLSLASYAGKGLPVQFRDAAEPVGMAYGMAFQDVSRLLNEEALSQLLSSALASTANPSGDPEGVAGRLKTALPKILASYRDDLLTQAAILYGSLRATDREAALRAMGMALSSRRVRFDSAKRFYKTLSRQYPL